MKHLILLFTAGLCLSLNGQIEITGDTCTGTTNYYYSFNNYEYGYHGYGYNIYRNGQLVFNDDDYYGFKHLAQMHFINDSTGFIFCYYGIKKTTSYGETWETFSNYPTAYDQIESNGRIYFINSDIGYFASYYKDSCHLHKIVKDDIKQLAGFKFDSTSKHITITDSITNTDYFCDYLNNLDFNWYLEDDTVQISLNFKADRTVFNEYKEIDVNIYPNPFTNYIQIESNQLINNTIVCLYNSLGKEIHRFKYDQLINEKVYLLGKPGIYYIEVVIPQERAKVYKLIKQ